VQALLDQPRVPSKKIGGGHQLSWLEEQKLKETALRIFQWGGVTRGKTKRDPSAKDIRNVIASAITWERVEDAPLDSGWTKLAAFGTDWLEDVDGGSQVIYDSRVAFSLIRRIEALLTSDHSAFVELGPFLREHLRYIPGRGGSRASRYPIGWKSGWGRWPSQYFASLFVGLLRNSLNSDPTFFGRMPQSDALAKGWTTRGVEMVLFMDGY